MWSVLAYFQTNVIEITNHCLLFLFQHQVQVSGGHGTRVTQRACTIIISMNFAIGKPY